MVVNSFFILSSQLSAIMSFNVPSLTYQKLLGLVACLSLLKSLTFMDRIQLGVEPSFSPIQLLLMAIQSFYLLLLISFIRFIDSFQMGAHCHQSTTISPLSRVLSINWLVIFRQVSSPTLHI